MRSLGRWLSMPLRRWRTRGFGIHSPFAFDFVTKVIGEKDEYYAYDAIRALGDNRPQELMLIFRCVVRFRPAVVSVDDIDSFTALTIKAADSRTSVVGHDPALRPSVSVIDDPCRPIADTGADIVIVRGIDRRVAPAWDKIVEGMNGGMTFSDGRIGIAVRLGHLPRQSFKIYVK